MGINLNGTGGGIVLNGTRDPGLEKAINEEIAARKSADEVLDEKKTDKPTLSSDTESINIDTNSGNKVTVLTDKGVSTLVSGKVDKADGLGLSQVKKIQQSTWVSSDDSVPLREQFKFTLQDNTKKQIEYYSCETTNDLLAKKSDKTTYINMTTGNAITYDLKNEYNRMTSYINAGSAATSVAILVSDGVYNNDYISELSFYTGYTPPEFSYPSSPYTMYFIGAECTTSNGMSVFSPLPNKVYDIVFYFNGGYIIGLVVSYDHVA